MLLVPARLTFFRPSVPPSADRRTGPGLSGRSAEVEVYSVLIALGRARGGDARGRAGGPHVAGHREASAPTAEASLKMRLKR